MKINSIAAFQSKYNKFNKNDKIINSNNNTASSSVSFGLVPPVPPVPVDPLTLLAVMAVEGLIFYGGFSAKDGIEQYKDKKNQIMKYRNDFREIIAQDIERYKQAYNFTDKEAENFYKKRLKNAIATNYNRDLANRGLNAVDGHIKERFQLLNSVVMPVIEAEKSPNAKVLVPNCILLKGKNPETCNKLINALEEHLTELDQYVWTKNIAENPDIEQLNNLVESAENAYLQRGHYTFIHLKNVDKLNSNNIVMDFLKNKMENSSKHGVVFIIDSQNPKDIDRSLLRPGRCDVKIDVEQTVDE